MGEKKGFILPELVCAMAIVAVLSGISITLAGNVIYSAEEANERIQAKKLWMAVQMYMMEEHFRDGAESRILMEELGSEPLNSEWNPLNQYLNGSLSEPAVITNVTVSKNTGEVRELVYLTDIWKVVVSSDGIVLERR